MPTITIRANQSGGRSRETFSERVVAAHLRDEHYAPQLIERLVEQTQLSEPQVRLANTDESYAVASGTNADRARVRGEGHSRSYTRPFVSYLGPQA